MPNAAARLVRWDTPFADILLPSASIIVSRGSDGNSDLVTAVVAADQKAYPKFLVHFGEVLAFTCMEEMLCPEREDLKTATWVGSLSTSYEVVGSTWLESYYKGQDSLFGPGESLHHYFIAGGDNNVEVITKNIPKVEVVSEPRVLDIRVVL